LFLVFRVNIIVFVVAKIDYKRRSTSFLAMLSAENVKKAYFGDRNELGVSPKAARRLPEG